MLIQLSSRKSEWLKPSRKDKIRDNCIANLIAIVIGFTRIRDFIGVKPSRRVAGLDKGSEVNVWICQYLQKFVTYHRPGKAGANGKVRRSMVGRDVAIYSLLVS